MFAFDKHAQCLSDWELSLSSPVTNKNSRRAHYRELKTTNWIVADGPVSPPTQFGLTNVVESINKKISDVRRANVNCVQFVTKHLSLCHDDCKLARGVDRMTSLNYRTPLAAVVR